MYNLPNRRDVKVTSEYFLVSPATVVAEIGGYASLLLGFSLFNLTDFASVIIAKLKSKSSNSNKVEDFKVESSVSTASVRVP